MKIFKCSLFVCLLFFPFLEIFSQNGFEINENFDNQKFDNFIKIHKTTSDITADYLKDNNDIIWETNKVSYGFSKKYYWLKFSLNNTTDQSKNLYFEINNPHLKYIEFYELENHTMQLKYHCGDYMSFDSRPIDNEKFVFPINIPAKQTNEFYIKIDKRNTSISFPTYLWDQNAFIKNGNKTKLFNGMFFGGFLICLLFSTLSFLSLKRRVYFWYSLYIITSGLYLFTTMGFSFQYLYPNQVVFTSFFRMVTLILGTISLLKFSQSFLKTKIYASKIHFLMNWISIGLLFLTLIILITPSFFQAHLTILVKLIYVFILSSLISYFLAAIFTYSKQKRIVFFYLISFGALFLCGGLALIFEYGWLTNLRLYIPVLFIGTLIEIVILGIGLLNEIRLIYKEKNNLSIKIANKQHEIVQAYVDGMEKEKLRISNELHDDIGSRMANFLRQVDHEKSLPNTSRKKITLLIDDIRKISHQLSPNKGDLLSFKERLQNLVEEAFIGDKITCEFQFLGEANSLNKKEELNLYRILQEFLHNILKHSNATSVEIQFINLENEITITIEDNGVGFDIHQKRKGLGLENIQKRMDYLKGQLEISSIHNKGTFIVISIPLNSHN